jgi:hypothetical protein
VWFQDEIFKRLSKLEAGKEDQVLAKRGQTRISSISENNSEYDVQTSAETFNQANSASHKQ